MRVNSNKCQARALPARGELCGLGGLLGRPHRKPQLAQRAAKVNLLWLHQLCQRPGCARVSNYLAGVRLGRQPNRSPARSAPPVTNAHNRPTFELSAGAACRAAALKLSETKCNYPAFTCSLGRLAQVPAVGSRRLPAGGAGAGSGVAGRRRPAKQVARAGRAKPTPVVELVTCARWRVRAPLARKLQLPEQVSGGRPVDHC